MKRIFARRGMIAAAAVTLVSSGLARAAAINVIDTVTAGSYTFTNFNGPAAGNSAGAGTNINGISNAGVAVGFDISDANSFSNFTANPPTSNTANQININGSTSAMAFGINAAGVAVGSDGNGNALSYSGGTVSTFIPLNGSSATAFGINDSGITVGQYTTPVATPGFIRTGASSYITVNAPSGPNILNAQGINGAGLVAGFYVGNDGQDHGFLAKESAAVGGSLTGTAVADPIVPFVAGEPGATFVFSQLLGVNDSGTVVGYYGDSTASQHGLLYNSLTGQYAFLDDPDMQFSNGVEVTQITGINNAGEISGLYSDANGVFHGFTATPVPEPTAAAALVVIYGAMLACRRRS